MIKVKVNEILEKNDRNIRWLSSKTNITYSTLYNFINGKTNAVSYNILETICDVLKCDIGDVLEIKKG